MEQEEYTKEEIDWSYIQFVDNQEILDLIEKVNCNYILDVAVQFLLYMVLLAFFFHILVHVYILAFGPIAIKCPIATTFGVCCNTPYYPDSSFLYRYSLF
jgi:hypothetical protein